MKVSIAQMNPTLGDFSLNAEKILSSINIAKDQMAQLIVFPEAALFGYHPVDLLERKSVVDEQLKYLNLIVKKMPSGIAALVGCISINESKKGKPFYNSAALLRRAKKPKIFNKELLPTYDVFDEARHIEEGDLSKNIFKIAGKNVLVTICEDIWGWDLPGGIRTKYKTNPLVKVRNKKFDLVVNLSASPFTELKVKQRKYVTSQTAKYLKAPMIYVNMVGAQDELVFDGGSLVLNKKGEVLQQLEFFKEIFTTVDIDNIKKIKVSKKSEIELKHDAIVLGIKDFVSKVGFSKVHFGLSGGIDSAVVACLAERALGSGAVTAVAMPSQYNDERSLIESRKLAEKLRINFLTFPIKDIYDQSVRTIEKTMGDLEFGLMHENLQARSRGMLLMALSNLKASLLLNTSNKSELSMGYSTLYGDLCGGLSPIGDLLKTEVFELAEWINREKEIIPRFIIDRPPSAELRPNQTDQDSLPEYDVLDESVQRLVINCKKPRNEVDKRVLSALMRTEFKRWQAPPIIKVSDHAFGRGRRLPIAHRANT